jgi:hypothetical protein
MRNYLVIGGNDFGPVLRNQPTGPVLKGTDNEKKNG